MGRVVVIGDVGGHFVSVRQALSVVGVHDHVPDGTVVIQVGDLIDRGPASDEVLELVKGFLDDEPCRWIQLAGNHESQYFPGGTPFWPTRLSTSSSTLLRAWWEAEQMRMATAVRTEEGDEWLITHAGLTVDCWRALGEPMSAAAAAEVLNTRPEAVIWRGGDGVIDRGAGPLWAEAGWELHEPWMEHYHAGGFVPFGQIHGHSSIVSYSTRAWRAPGRVRQRAHVDWEARHFAVRVGGRRFIGIDPKHGTVGAPTWQPLVLEGAELLDRLGQLR